jgi:hypothetical protein
MSFDRSEGDKRMLARPTEAERTAGTLGRIADALERLVTEAGLIRHSLATAASLQALRPNPLEQHSLHQHPFHEFKPHPDLSWMCERCGGGQNEDCHEKPAVDLDGSIDAFAPFYIMSVRACNVLRAAGVLTVRQLTEKTEAELLRIPGIGRAVSSEIMSLLKAEGLTLKNWRPTA